MWYMDAYLGVGTCLGHCGIINNTGIINFRDTAYTAMGIDSHTDGNYFLDAPGEH